MAELVLSPSYGPEDFEAMRSDDAVKTDLELTCVVCGEVVCDVEHGDTLAVLLGVARDHCKAEHKDLEWKVKDHG